MASDPKIHNRKVKVQAVGRLEMLPENVREAIIMLKKKLLITLIFYSRYL